MKKAILLSTIAALCCGLHRTRACTGIALSAADGSYVQSRTIEWSRGVLRSQYVVIPRGQQLRSFTPTGANGLAFTARYGTVGLAVEQQEFIAEGINEAGLSAGLFFFPPQQKKHLHGIRLHHIIAPAPAKLLLCLHCHTELGKLTLQLSLRTKYRAIPR